MTHVDFISLLRVIYDSLLRSVHGVQAQSKIVQSTLESLSYVIPVYVELDTPPDLISI